MCSQGIFKKQTFFKGKKLKSYNGKEATDVADMMQMLFELSGSVRELMALILVIKRTKTDTSIQTWIDGQQVMDKLKISRRTLQSMRSTGALPFSRLNGKYYYKVTDLEQLLNKNYKSPQNLKQP